MSKQQEKFNPQPHQIVEVTKTSLNGGSTYRILSNKNGENSSDLEHWISVIGEYKAIKNRTSKLSRSKREYVERIVDILVEGNKIILNEDYTLKSFYFNGQEINVPTKIEDNE